MLMNWFTNPRKSILRTACCTRRCCTRHLGEIDSSKAAQAFSDHASDAATMYAQFELSVFTGA